jgi:hypothetical protein
MSTNSHLIIIRTNRRSMAITDIRIIPTVTILITATVHRLGSDSAFAMIAMSAMSDMAMSRLGADRLVMREAFMREAFMEEAFTEEAFMEEAFTGKADGDKRV